MISEPLVRSTQTMHLTYVMVSTFSKQTENELPLEPHHLGLPSGAPETISEPMVRSTQTMHLSCVKISTVSKQAENELPPEPHHLVVPSGASKKFVSLWYI